MSKVTLDDLSYESLKPFLHSKVLGNRIVYYSSVSSTQTIAHELALSGAAEGSVVIADEQLQGKGRLGRKWFSPPKSGVWMSIILRANIAMVDASQITLLSALAVLTAIKKITDLSLYIKWPNDLFINGKKIAGILAEVKGKANVEYLIVGIGVNVNLQKDQMPIELRQVATSLSLELGKKVNRARLASQILYELEKLYNDYVKILLPELIR